jgi:gluconate 2-dehydrogenase gamma chain
VTERAERREALKIIGAIGVSCMFPYQADELYGQHVHAEGQPAQMPLKPVAFKKGEFALVSRLTDLIIPATDTPGALGAGVPFYIDYVVSANAKLLAEFRTGLAWLRRQRFLSLDESRQIAILEALSKRAEAGENGASERFWRTLKSMTADGYYTSKIGLRDELGYLGNTVRDHFPESEIPEH